MYFFNNIIDIIRNLSPKNFYVPHFINVCQLFLMKLFYGFFLKKFIQISLLTQSLWKFEIVFSYNENKTNNVAFFIRFPGAL